MTTAPRIKWTYDVLATEMAQAILVYINTGDDRRAYYLAIPCDDFPVQTRRAKWELADKQRAALQSPEREAKPKPMVWHNGRRYSADALEKMAVGEAKSFILPAPQPVAEKAEKDNSKALTKDDRAVAPEIKRRACSGSIPPRTRSTKTVLKTPE